MEEKDVNSIASAVSNALAKLNADTREKEANDKRSDNKNESEAETFKCPDCGGEVTGGIQFCANCGCELEWGD